MPSPNSRKPAFGLVRESRPTRRWLTDAELAASHAVDWDEVIPHELIGCIAAVTRAGAAIMFAESGDGGVLRVQIFDDPERPKWYVRDADDLNILLRKLAEMARGLPPGGEHAS